MPAWLRSYRCTLLCSGLLWGIAVGSGGVIHEWLFERLGAFPDTICHGDDEIRLHVILEEATGAIRSILESRELLDPVALMGYFRGKRRRVQVGKPLAVAAVDELWLELITADARVSLLDILVQELIIVMRR